VFEGFFATMRAEGVPVAADEWLLLQEALGRGLADSRLSGFYLVARAVCVKSERHYDAYDVAFARYFGGVAGADGEIADQVWEWLDEHPEALRLSPEQRARMEALLERLDHDEIRRRLQERLENQTEAHRGGSRHIGTGGTAPFGHSGYHPGGFRIGGEGRNRSAVQVASQRRWRGYRADATLGVREMGLALRRLRQLSTRLDGPLTELDLDDTIDATAEGGGRLHLVFRRPRRNAVRVLLLLDVGGSMDEHAELLSRLFSAVHQATHFRDLTVRYFHNCVYDRLYETPFLDPARADTTLSLLAQLSPEYKLVIVGDGCMAPSELVMPGGAIDFFEDNAEPGHVWLDRLAGHFSHSAWLNPIPASWWDAVYGAQTLHAIRRIFPMHELTLDGLQAAVAELMVRR
jgi:uncharacterized protein with von Willebrand factor type A (vWA) domain